MTRPLCFFVCTGAAQLVVRVTRIGPERCACCLQFRNMWAEFEWENKVAVNTSIPDVNDFLEHIIRSTNMKCLTP